LSKPDLVVLSGDAISGGWVRRPGAFEETLRQATEPMVEAKIPYAYILGNHDAEGLLSRNQIIKHDQENIYSVRKQCDGIPETSNFLLPIFSGHDDEKIATNLWFFDSGSEGCDGFENTWGCVEPEILNWYDAESKRFKEEHGTDVHHIAFVHIPIPEYADIISDKEIYGTGLGEEPCCPFVNTGFFDRIKKNGDISAMFVGHDHTNNIGGYLDGIELAYGQKSGYGSYGNERGGRVIVLKEDENKKVTRRHYVLREDGTFGLTEPRKKWRKSVSCAYFGFKPIGYLKRMIWSFRKWLRS